MLRNNIFDSIIKNCHKFTRLEVQAADYILALRQAIPHIASSALSDACGVSDATITRFPNSPGAQYTDLLLICGADEAPRQQGSVAVKLGQLFIIDILFHEFCSRDPEQANASRERTLSATNPMLL